jgi:hypothetical protein
VDTVYFKQLERLFMKSAPYMGPTWRKGVIESLAAMQTEMNNLSSLAASNLENAVNAESVIKSLRDEVQLMTVVYTEVDMGVDETVEIKQTVIEVPVEVATGMETNGNEVNGSKTE